MDIGKDNGEPVSLTYADRSPFAFTGAIGRGVSDVGGGPAVGGKSGI